MNQDFGDTDIDNYDVSKTCQTTCLTRNCNRDNNVENLFATYVNADDSYPKKQYCKAEIR